MVAPRTSKRLPVGVPAYTPPVSVPEKSHSAAAHSAVGRQPREQVDMQVKGRR